MNAVPRCALIAVLVLVSVLGSGGMSSADGDIEQRIAEFWKRVDALRPVDHLSAEDLGLWALNVIERDKTARISVAEFRSSTAAMQTALERAGPAATATRPPAPGIEQRIAKFWKRLDALQPSDHLAAKDLGQWALNVIDRDSRARITVADFRGSTAGMQAGMDRARSVAPVPAPPAQLASPLLVFGDEISTADREAVTTAVKRAYDAVSTLLSASLPSLSAFVGSDAAWLAHKSCDFYGHSNKDCYSSKTASFASGGNAAEGGPGGIFVYWASDTYRHPVVMQKVIAHEVFHVFQYALDGPFSDGETPLDQVRPSGPVWLLEGAAELVAYRVTSDLGLQPYATSFAQQVQQAKRISTPLDQIVTVDQGNRIDQVYALYEVAVDHLVSVAGGFPALAAYHRAIGAGAAWPAAFQHAFGRSVDAFYKDFATYRAKL